MALFPQKERVQGSRSNTTLTRSGHASPACDWIVSRDFYKTELQEVFPNGVLFQYPYGGDGLTDVVIPKGRIVGVAKSIFDYESGVTKTPLTLPGLTKNKNVVGMVYMNICKDMLQFDMFGGNKPAIITEETVVLPFMPGITPETTYTADGVKKEEKKISQELKMPWGAVIGKVEEGDYVKATPSGRVCKWDRTGADKDDPMSVVGQVLELDINQESIGWEKWMLWDESYRPEDAVDYNKSGVSNLKSEKQFPFDANYDENYYKGYRENLNSYQSLYTNNPTGIPGLHDGSGDYPGFGRNDLVFTDVELGKTPATITEEKIVFAVRALDASGMPAKNIVAEGLTVKIDNTAVDAKDISVDEVAGIINITVEKTKANKDIKATYKMKFYGTPTYLDFKGVVGSATILLKM